MMHQEKSRNLCERPYAGFWVRTFAFVLDALLFGFILKALNSVFAFAPFFWLTTAIDLMVFWLYYALPIFKWGVTPGKKIIGLEVQNLRGYLVSLWQASGRAAVAMIVYGLILALPMFFNTIRLYVMPIFDWGTYLIFLVITVPILMMLFNQRKQVLHDWIARTVVVDVHACQKAAGDASGLRGGIRFVSLLGVIVGGLFFAYYYGVFLFVMGTYALSKKHQYDASFHATYAVEDYNDTRIQFYQKELEKYSESFVQADGMYDIFAADTQRDLALNCIEAFLKEHNNSNWIDMGSRFRRQARNKFANTPEIIRKAKKNEDHMGKHFYDYDLNDVNHIEDEIASKWELEKNSHTCNTLMSAERMYKELFIPKYIQNREKALGRDKSKLDTAPEHGTLDKRFYRRGIRVGSKWLDDIYAHFPTLLQKKQAEEQKLDQEKKRALQEALKREAKEAQTLETKYQNELKNAQYPLFIAMRYKRYKEIESLLNQGADTEARDRSGRTPLMHASCDKMATQILLDHGADMNAFNSKSEYTAFAWFVSNVRDSYECSETLKIYFNHNVDVNYQVNKSETALTVAAKGCRHFDVVKKLLDHGADPDLTDEYGMTTRTGLSRYCRDKEAYKKMMDIISKHKSFF